MRDHRGDKLGKLGIKCLSHRVPNVLLRKLKYITQINRSYPRVLYLCFVLAEAHVQALCFGGEGIKSSLTTHICEAL